MIFFKNLTKFPNHLQKCLRLSDLSIPGCSSNVPNNFIYFIIEKFKQLLSDCLYYRLNVRFACIVVLALVSIVSGSTLYFARATSAYLMTVPCLKNSRFAGQRYWFFPIFAFVFLYFWCLLTNSCGFSYHINSCLFLTDSLSKIISGLFPIGALRWADLFNQRLNRF